MNGLMEESMMANGRKIICMEEVSIHGKMVDVMKENTIMTESMAMAFTYGKMEGNMLDNGQMESSTVKVLIDRLIKKREEVYGKMERGFGG